MPEAVPSTSARDPVTTSSNSRLLYLDYLRGFLMVLVIVHHVAINYGSEGSWYYKEKVDMPLWQILATTFCATNQFFFMGFFFFLSAYFIPGAIERKGAARFLKDRAIRLGIPLLCYVVFIHNLTVWLSAWHSPEFSFRNWLSSHLPLLNSFSPGPLWFVETLLFFSALCVPTRRFWARFSAHRPASTIRGTHLIVFGLVLACCSFPVRLAFPIGREFWHLQLAFFPQYILLFVLGVHARLSGWLENIPRDLERACLAVFSIAVAGIPTLLIYMKASGAPLSDAIGGLHWPALALCALEGCICPTAIVLLLNRFKRGFPESNRFWDIAARNSYGAYILHAPIAVAFGVLFHLVALPIPLKFATVSLLAVLGSIAASELLRRLPVARAIL